MKMCTKCKIEKEDSEFGFRKGRKDNKNSRCKSCNNSHSKNYASAHPDRRKLTCGNYYLNNKEKIRGYISEHRDSIRETKKAWRHNNIDKTREYSRRGHLNHKERDYNKCKTWRLANKDRVNSTKREWRANNRGVNLGYLNKWRTKNPNKVLASNHKRRARIRGSSGEFTDTEWKELCERYGNICLCCGEKRN